jgi:Multicopper oxidase
MKMADMLADNPGDWLFHCHVADHMREGMFAKMTVYARDAVGVDRSPEKAFFGVRGNASSRSLHFSRAEVVASVPVEIKLEVTATVFEAYAVFRQKLQVQLGDIMVAFSPDRRGAAQVSGPAGGILRITNAGEQGVVYGGLMRFELTLSGAAWEEELRKSGWSATDAATRVRPLALTITLGEAKHTAELPLGLAAKKR